MGIFGPFRNPRKILYRTYINIFVHYIITMFSLYINKTGIVDHKIRSGHFSTSDSLVWCPAGGAAFLLLRAGDVEAGVAAEGHLGPVHHGRVRVGELAGTEAGVAPAASFTCN